MALDEFDAARAIYRELLGRGLARGSAYLGLARVAYHTDDGDKALELLALAGQSGFAIPSEQHAVRILRARLLAAQRRHGEAWREMYAVWRAGDVAVRSSIYDEIQDLARQVPPNTEGVAAILQTPPPPPPQPGPAKVHPAIARPRAPAPEPQTFGILPRNAWQPRYTTQNSRTVPMGRPERITVHHSAHDNTDASPSAHETARLIRGMQEYHVTERRWADLGYHYVIDPRGRIWEGRPLRFQGAHAGNPETNHRNVGIVLMGDFENIRPPSAQVAALRWLIRQLSGKYGIPHTKIYGHCDLSATHCPGKHLQEIVKAIRAHGV